MSDIRDVIEWRRDAKRAFFRAAVCLEGLERGYATDDDVASALFFGARGLQLLAKADGEGRAHERLQKAMEQEMARRDAVEDGTR